MFAQNAFRRDLIMGKSLSCKDLGVGCDWHACAETEEELLKQAAAHAKAAHGMSEISGEMLTKAKAAIKEGSCPTAAH
jgi:predicted small metal-binding protein